MKELNEYSKRILVTGGAGFILGWLVEYFVKKYPDYKIVNFDCLDYCSNLENLKDIENEPNYVFVKGDVRNVEDIRRVFIEYQITDIIHGCAQSHVDRSLVNPNIFMETNVMGTMNLFNVAREFWKDNIKEHTIVNIGTDEQFGRCSLEDPNNMFDESWPIDPHSPYALSKSCQYLVGLTYYRTYGLNIVSTSCSNNYGGRQFIEKLIPLTILRLMEKEPIPLYTPGNMVRDWLPVSCHVKALDLVFHKGKPGELYCIGGGHPCSNLEVVNAIIEEFARQTKQDVDELKKLITFVPNLRKNAHDPAYRINHAKIHNELGWDPDLTFEEGIRETVKWYIDHKEWVEHCKSEEYRNWITNYYEKK